MLINLPMSLIKIGGPKIGIDSLNENHFFYANIVFSAILNTNRRIADLLINSKGTFDFIAPDYLLTETKKYHRKISLISGLTIDEVRNIEIKITKPISFLSGIHVP
jgi:predicted nucleic acid-binding protein